MGHDRRLAPERQPRNLRPLNGRQSATDSLGNFTQSTNTLSRITGPLAVRESQRATQTSFYPNPTTGVIAVQGALGLEGAPVEVRDLLGRAVLRTSCTMAGLI